MLNPVGHPIRLGHNLLRPYAQRVLVSEFAGLAIRIKVLAGPPAASLGPAREEDRTGFWR
ncbi:hypothetical protein ACFLIM_42630 [Nonomuraea sp. M3C6]|uniref:Uncharacterized protein n=1 Tax=Nonomuraea marmarensis TaxID=3351344 RepID=A0ABW7AR58_9ACTN